MSRHDAPHTPGLGTALRSALAILALVAAGPACRSTESHPSAPDRAAYATPEAAFAGLVDAARLDASPDGPIAEVLGPDTRALLAAGDPVQLENEVEGFLRLYDERHTVARSADGNVATLVVGADAWPFPVPAVRADGRWHFDTAQGLDEIVDRRIGRNEISAIQVCRAIVDAQAEYRELGPEGIRTYAASFFSDPGRKNGLHWPEVAGAPPSPLGELVARAAGEGYRRADSDEPDSYHGYHYRILTERGPAAPAGAGSYVVDGHLTGGFAVLAWPAEYGASGIMSFLTDDRGIVYERDLGRRTGELAASMEAFDPGAGWFVCED